MKSATNSEPSYLQVQFLTGWQQPLWYQVPTCEITPEHREAFAQELLLAWCFLRKTLHVGLVKKITPQLPQATNFKIRPIVGFVEIPYPIGWVKFLQEAEKLFAVDRIFLLRRLLPFFTAQPEKSELPKSDVYLCPTGTAVTHLALPAHLTLEQLAVAKELCKLLQAPTFAPALLHGVTGSGKSQIYLTFIAQCLAQGKSVIFLVPEISLAKYFLQFFRKELTKIVSFTPEIFAWHTTSMSNKAIRQELWEKVLVAKPLLVIGVHQPIFLPLQNLAAIIIDEEHEASFVEQQPPNLDTKLLALLLAQKQNIPIVLGSATPNVSSFYQTKTKKWLYFALSQRFAASPAKVTLAQLNYTAKPFWLTKVLLKKLTEKIACGQQSIVYLNRRGFAPITKCKGCQQIFTCTNCSVSLVLHIEGNNDGFTDDTYLSCHYCGYVRQSPFICTCGANLGVIHKGLGTQQVCQVLQKALPNARILRADKSSIAKKNWEAQLSSFASGSFDILVGTKTVTKGYHFPMVTFVTVLWADLDFAFPEYRTVEKGVQQMLQVAGRAGRGENPGEVLLQAFDTALLQDVMSEENYENFLEKELEIRNTLGYPPFTKLLFLQTGDLSAKVTVDKINSWHQLLQAFFRQHNIAATILGPAKPLVFRQNKIFLQQLMIKFYRPENLCQTIKFLKSKNEPELFYWVEV